MNVNGLTDTASIAQANLQLASESPSSGSFSAELTGTYQATTSQSLDTGASDDWDKIRGEFVPPDYLRRSWKQAVIKGNIRGDEDGSSFRMSVMQHQHALATADKEPALVTTALVAHIDRLEVSHLLLDALTMLLKPNDDERELAFDKNKLETLAASRWIECFPDDEKDQVRALIQNLQQAG